MTPQETLTAAADLLESSETAWMQGCMARDAAGNPVDIYHQEACSWSVMAAIDKATWNDAQYYAARDMLATSLGCPIPPWNNHPTTRREDVIAMLRKAAL